MSRNPRPDNKKKPPLAHNRIEDDIPLEVEPDDEEDRKGYGWSWSQRVSAKLHRERSLDAANGQVGVNGHARGNGNGNGHGHDIDKNAETVLDPNDVSIVDRSVTGGEAGHMSDVLRWALDSMHEPALAAADWLARDIDPEQPTATALLTNPAITLAQVKQAKSVFKTMRIVGEKSADRRIGARMYAASIAAGLVRHKKLVSRQAPDALKRGFQGLLDDQRMPQPLRDLAGMALCALNEKQFKVDANDEPARKSPVPKPVPRSNGKPRKR